MKVKNMPYSEMLIAPMRQDLTRFGLEEARTPADVDRLVAAGNGTVLMVTNSVCGCAAGKARPAIGMALKHARRPDVAATVFAGADEAAVAHLRGILSDYPPSSPSIALFKDGKPVYVMHRREIEPRDAFQIARMLTEAFDRYCSEKPVAV
jgi:putative YphP/YqiW family bacilliredoxin